MTIIHCLNHYLPENIGGTEVYTHNLAGAQIRDGNTVSVLIPAWGESREWYFEGIRVNTFPVSKTISRDVRAGHRKPEGIDDFLKKLHDLQPDVIHFHEFTQGNGLSFHHLIAASKAGYNTIVTLHLAGYTCKTGELMYKGEEPCDGIAEPLKCAHCIYAYRNISPVKSKILHTVSSVFYKVGINTSKWYNTAGTALGIPYSVQQSVDVLKQVASSVSTIITLNNWYRNILVKNGIPESKVVTIQQGLVHKEFISAGTSKVGSPLRVVYLGRISPIKGLHLLLNALREIPADLITLDIYGREEPGEYNLMCRHISKQQSNIQWKGSISPKEVIQTLSSYNLLVLPSLSEMSSLVIPEAFAAGLPVLASSIMGNLEMVKDGVNGFFFSFNDSEDLQRQLVRLVSYPSLIECARKNLSEVRDFDVVWSEYKLVYPTEVTA